MRPTLFRLLILLSSISKHEPTSHRSGFERKICDTKMTSEINSIVLKLLILILVAPTGRERLPRLPSFVSGDAVGGYWSKGPSAEPTRYHGSLLILRLWWDVLLNLLPQNALFDLMVSRCRFLYLRTLQSQPLESASTGFKSAHAQACES